MRNLAQPSAHGRVTDYAIKRLTPPRSQSQRRRRSRNLDSIMRIRVRASCSTSPMDLAEADHATVHQPDITLQMLCDRPLTERGVKADTSIMSRFFRRI